MIVFSILAIVLIITLVIVVHEFGHFILAKKNGIAVIEFSVGMGPRIFSFVRNGTRYSLKWIPFGGSCQMLGNDEGIPDADEDVKADAEHAFYNKSVWARISVAAAGPIFNFALAFVLAVIVVSSVGANVSYIQGVIDGGAAKQAGLQEGDKITKMNGETIHLYKEMMLYLQMHPGEVLDVEYVRDGETYQTTITPVWDEESQKYLMGIQGVTGLCYDVSVGEVFQYGFYEMKYSIVSTIKSLGMLFQGKLTMDDFSGPVGMTTMVNDLVEDVSESTQGEDFGTKALMMFVNLANFTLLLSANLGVLNLLPIPGLDGGQLVFLIIEAIKGKPVSSQKVGLITMIGFICLMVFMVFVLFNDVKKIFM